MALIEKLTAIGDAIRSKTGKTDGLTLDAMPGEIKGIQSGGSVITEEWQRPSAWPDLSSLGVPDPGTVYLTFDCRDAKNGIAPTFSFTGWLLSGEYKATWSRGYVQNGDFVVVEEGVYPFPNPVPLPADEGDFVVYRLTNCRNIGLEGDSNAKLSLVPLVEVYGTEHPEHNLLTDGASYRVGVSARTKAVTIYNRKLQNKASLLGGSAPGSTLEYVNVDEWTVDSTCTSFNGLFFNMNWLKVSSLPYDTTNITDMANMFRSCAITHVDVSTFDTASVTNMQYMFNSCTGLVQLNLSNFRTSKVTNMTAMFGGCNCLYDLDFSNLDTSAVTSTPIKMFDNCQNLTNLRVGKINKSFAFTNCNSLSHESLLNVIAALEATENALTLTIGSTNLKKLTEEEIAVATEKGWTVV